MILLDTNAYTAFFKSDHRVKQKIDKSSKVFLSVVSIGELMSGFKKGDREKENLKQLEDFLEDKKVQPLTVTLKTAKVYATIKYQLSRRGTPIPTNDIWIAAQARQTNAELITFDNHFLKIKNLQIWKGLTR